MGIHFTGSRNGRSEKCAADDRSEAGALWSRPTGEAFTVPGSTRRASVPGTAKYKGLVAKHDADGKFRNRFLESTIYAESESRRDG